jgi:chromosome partitioning protein
MRNILKQGLRRLSGNRPERPRGSRSATVIAVAARKGGVGKTTTAVNLAAAFGRYYDRKVLLLDLDGQNNVTTALATQFRPTREGISAVFAESPEVDLIDLVVPTDAPGLNVVGPAPSLNELEHALAPRIGKEYILRDALEVARTHYDLIIIDTPPAIGNLALNALVAADQVLIPTLAASLSIEGVNALIDVLARVGANLNPKLDVLGILLTMYDARTTSLNDAMVAELEEAFGDILLPTRVPRNVDIGKAQHAGKNIFDFSPDSRGAAAYREVAEKVLARL